MAFKCTIRSHLSEQKFTTLKKNVCRNIMPKNTVALQNKLLTNITNDKNFHIL